MAVTRVVGTQRSETEILSNTPASCSHSYTKFLAALGDLTLLRGVQEDGSGPSHYVGGLDTAGTRYDPPPPPPPPPHPLPSWGMWCCCGMLTVLLFACWYHYASCVSCPCVRSQLRDGCDTSDGVYTLVWRTTGLSVAFHVATLMPTNAEDRRCSNKKRHIGNNFVTLVFLEPGGASCVVSCCIVSLRVARAVFSGIECAW